jgi:hypothetical protein
MVEINHWAEAIVHVEAWRSRARGNLGCVKDLPEINQDNVQTRLRDNVCMKRNETLKRFFVQP